ncbi:MAG: pyridoxamine 5'-phosphate oxidase family protein [Acidimicrobiales bacterium]
MGVNQRSRIKMNPDEIQAFLEEERTAVMCSMHPEGTIHAVAMWYAFLEGAVAVETKAKSQKVQNLRRDPRLTMLVEAGDTYETLRGVELVGRGEIVEEPARLWEFGVTMHERYLGPYTEDQRGVVEVMMHNRVVVRLAVDKVVSWDHRKL